MANRSIELTLKSNVSGLVSGLKTAQTAASNAGREFSNFTKTNEQAMTTAGSAFMKGGAVAVAGAGLAVKAAMDWESAWAGVMKTNEGTSAQTQALEEDLRALTGVLPATHEEIAGVAEAAGQLGVSIDDVAGFSEVMLNLGETTNMSADEAATSIARFSNIMGTAFGDAEKLGSTIVGLGNNFATTEAEIMDMSLRIAAIGTQMGMTEADVLGMATAMSSVGISSEAGGTAITMVMKKIDAAVREGGESLTGWAEAAGVSAEEFAAAWQSSPAEAMVLLTNGLGEVNAAGGDVNAMLADLGIKGIRESDTMLRLASSSELLSDALAMGADEWAKNTALAAEAELRYETTEAKISMAWNQIKDAAITAGGAILPVIGGIAESIGGVAEWFAGLPEPVMGALTALSGVAGVTALAGGAFLTLAPRVMDTVRAVQDLRSAAPKTTSVLGDLGKTAGIMAAAIGGLSILSAVHNHFLDGIPTIEEWGQALLEAKENADAINDMDFSPNDWSMGDDIDSLGAALDNINAGGLRGFGHSVNDAVESLVGWRSQNHEVEDSVASLDRAMASAFGSGSLDEAADGFRQAVEQGKQFGLSIDQVAESFPEYLDGIRAMATEHGVTLTDAELLRAALGDLPPELQAVADGTSEAADGAAEANAAIEGMAAGAEQAAGDLDDLLKALQDLGLAERDAREASRQYQAAIDEVTESIKSNGTSLDENTEKGRANAAALDGIASAGLNSAVAMAQNGATHEELSAQLSGTYDQLVKSAGQFGLNKEEADAYARSVLGIPDDVSVETFMDERAREIAEQTQAAVEAIPGYKAVTIAVSEDGTAGSVQMRIDAVTGKTEYVFVTDDGTITTVQQGIVNIDGVDRTVWVDDNGTIYSTQSEIDAVRGKNVTITADAATAGAEGDLNHTARDRYARIFASVSGVSQSPSVGRGTVLRPGGYTGGIVGSDFGLAGYATGGRLPYTGRGTDQILGLSSAGRPTALVDDGEWVIRERQARKFDGLLNAVNSNHPSVQHLAGYYNGGSVGREWSGSSAGAAAGGNVTASVDASVIAGAVASAIAGYQPVVKIGMREFIGEMKQDRAWKGGS